MSDGGKGSARRPMAVSDQDYANRWDAIFGRDQPKQQHAFRHQGSGIYTCIVCGKNEKYADAGETCRGEPK